MIKLGDKVKDSITDFKGTVVAKIVYLNGCVRYEVKSKELKDGKTIESEWIDEGQLTICPKSLSFKGKAKTDKEIRRNSGGPGNVPSEINHP